MIIDISIGPLYSFLSTSIESENFTSNLT